MVKLLVGFDSAWSENNSGAIVGLLCDESRSYKGLGAPQNVTFEMATKCICDWQSEHKPSVTIVMIDQPTIVKNMAGQRPVENTISPLIGRLRGGAISTNTANATMFGEKAPIWKFLDTLGGPANPLDPTGETLVFETYPVLAMIALDWMLPDDERSEGRLPKYNPDRQTFNINDWKHVCCKTKNEIECLIGKNQIVEWIASLTNKTSNPSKAEQDRLDACICLIMAIHYFKNSDCLMVGDLESGYMIVPNNPGLCRKLGRTGKVSIFHRQAENK